jgi:hypothetical protein
MCPNCFSSIAMTLGGAGSAVLPSLLLGASLAVTGLRFRTAGAREPAQSYCVS